MAKTWRELFNRAPDDIDEEAVTTALRKRRENAAPDEDDSQSEHR